MPTLPQKFADRMEKLLGEEYPLFEKALAEAAAKAFRINTLKCKDKDSVVSLFSAGEVPYSENCYYLSEDAEGIGNTPYHHSGMIYLQDPGAMATVAALKDKEGFLGARVCDLCSAPGGKSSHIAEIIGEGGFLLANEFVPKRAKILVGNFERLGIKNASVTSLDTGELSRLYQDRFDLVIADAPCSGEGMFRKGESALDMWSEENIALCRDRQDYILDNAAKMVKGGGYLLYSTCTYSLEENEMAVDAFLARHGNFSLEKVSDEVIAYTADGINFEGAKSQNLNLCRRFYPHRARGEGQFIALMKKNGEGKGNINFEDAAKPLKKEEAEIINRFFKENLEEIPEGKIIKQGENYILSLHGEPLPPKSVFSGGILIGEIRGKMLFPSHQFFSALGKHFKIKAELSEQEALLYLRGEEIPTEKEARGWCAVNFLGATLGGGKISEGRIKNHYPKGLRLKG